MDNIINIGNRREFFWDNTLIDTKRTRTQTKLHHMEKRECVIKFDEKWGGDGCNYISVIQDGDIYRMYVNVHKTPVCPDYEQGGPSFELYLESNDGINWEKPALGIYKKEGYEGNNVMFTYEDGKPTTNIGDGFRVMIDPRPECLPEEKYKALADTDGKLHLFVSGDGKYFNHVRQLDIKGVFDSVNTLMYDPRIKKFRCFYRDYHPTPNPMVGYWYRDIRVTESEDLINWSEGKILNYDSHVDWQLYTNAISVYYRGDHTMVGFPARLVSREKNEWSPNYDQLCGRELRRDRYDNQVKRYAMDVTDCLFMTSRDGFEWKRYNDAFLRPGPESGRNWCYGDCYISAGLVETKSEYEGCDNEISMYVAENRWIGIPGEIYRYTIRLDGFVSQFAEWDSTWETPALVTKKFIFDGDELRINFATSAFGHMQIKIIADDGTWAQSGEIFGDSTNRLVPMEQGSPLSELAGKPVVMEIKMRDADIYSFKFE